MLWGLFSRLDLDSGLVEHVLRHQRRELVPEAGIEMPNVTFFGEGEQPIFVASNLNDLHLSRLLLGFSCV
jgi:hypothetical protein